MSSSNVAWAHHNAGAALLQLDRLEEALDCFRKAAHERGAAGTENEPQQTLAKAATLAERVSTTHALVLYDEAAATLAAVTTSAGRSLVGNILLSAARLRWLELNRVDDALRDVERAKPLLREFHEDAEAYASALNIEAYCCDATNQRDRAAAARAERVRFLAERPHLETAQLERAIAGESDHQVEMDEKTRGRVEVVKGLTQLENLSGSAFTDKLEELATETVHGVDDDRYAIAASLLALGGARLTQDGKLERALSYFLRAVATHPADLDHRTRLGACLLNLKRFAEAAELGMRLAVDAPASHLGFLLSGAAAYQAGDYGLAYPMLSEALAKSPGHPVAADLLAKTEDERRKVILQGGAPPTSLLRTFSPTNAAAFLDYLRAFAQRARLNSDSFWKKRSANQLVQNPENAARALLAQDIAATCRAAAIYKEAILAGGRIDLIVNVKGHEFITELKICGAGYSRTWAEGGFDQLRQYLRERGATRGFLVIFDARVDQSDSAAFPPEVDLGDGLKAFCVVVNVRGMG